MLLPRGCLLDLAPTVHTGPAGAGRSVLPAAPLREFRQLPEPGATGADAKCFVRSSYCPYTALAVRNWGEKSDFGVNLERIDILVLLSSHLEIWDV